MIVSGSNASETLPTTTGFRNVLNSKCQGLPEMQELAAQALERELLGFLLLCGLSPRRYGEAPLISVLLKQVRLNAGSFGCTTHRLIFMAIERLYRHEEPFDVVTVHEELQLSGDLVPLGELAELAASTPQGMFEKCDAVARIVKGFGDLRSASAVEGAVSRELMRFRDAMEHGYSHGAVWWTDDPQWFLCNPRGEHLCYAYHLL